MCYTKPKSLSYNFKFYMQINNKLQITLNRFAKAEYTIKCLNVIDKQIGIEFPACIAKHLNAKCFFLSIRKELRSIKIENCATNVSMQDNVVFQLKNVVRRFTRK